jgi:hypothetical protein
MAAVRNGNIRSDTAAKQPSWRNILDKNMNRRRPWKWGQNVDKLKINLDIRAKYIIVWYTLLYSDFMWKVCFTKLPFFLYASCLTTGPKPLPKPDPHTVQSIISYLNSKNIFFQSSSSCLLLPPPLFFLSIFFNSIRYFRRKLRRQIMTN